MSSGVGRRALWGILIGAIVLLVLVLAAQAWLSSGIGKGVVESRLSAAFGRPVRLDGDFAIGILPVPGASGTDLRLFTRDGRWLVADAGSFLARLSVLPLLRGEVEVTALELEDAGIDVGRLASEPPVAQDHPGDFFRIPDIRSFELVGVLLYFDGMGSQPYVRIGELTIDDFQVDAPAPFEAGISLVSGDRELVGIAAGGQLTLWARGVVEVDLSRFALALDGWIARGFKGGISADFSRSIFGLDLRLNRADKPFSLGAQVAWEPRFAAEVSGYLIEEVELVLGAQRISGAGCVLDGTPPALHAQLSSQSIDLDAMYTLLESWRAPADGAAAIGRDSARQARSVAPGENGLPIGLAVRLEVQEATFEGAVAEGVRLSVGGQPLCPERQ